MQFFQNPCNSIVSHGKYSDIRDRNAMTEEFTPQGSVVPLLFYNSPVTFIRPRLAGETSTVVRQLT